MREIKLTRGLVTMIDDDWYEELSKYKWHAQWERNVRSSYAARRVCLSNGRRVTECMHRRILGLEYGDIRKVDHKNRVTLDNRAANLRVCTARENSNNRRNLSVYGVGVYKHTAKSKQFQARAWLNGRSWSIGYFYTAIDARNARRAWLKEKGII